MNGFKKHGIEHGSNSSIKAIMDNPANYIMNYLYAAPNLMGSPVDRGTSIEAGCEAVLFDKLSLDEGVNVALRDIDRRTAWKLSDVMLEKERERVEPTLRRSLLELAKYGEPLKPSKDRQHKISVICKTLHWALPIIGYLDFVFPDAPQGKTIIDLKTTSRIPTVMPADHQRQRAIYSTAKPGWAVKFLYVSPASAVELEDGDTKEIMTQIKSVLIRWEKFLSLGDVDYLASLIPADPTHRDFKSAHKQQLLREKFGFII